MLDSATVVWLTETPGAQASPSEEARQALEAWGRARGVRLAPPSETGAGATTIDWTAGDRVEQEIERAREALAGLDFDAAERALARAEAVLRDHAELPQAAWLRAEVEREWSARWLLGKQDPERAERAWQRAAALDGGREAGLGERGFEPGAAITATLRLEGDGQLRLDGATVAPGALQRGAGEHALAIVRRDGSVAWAGWVSLAQGSLVRVAAPPPRACSREDVARARVQEGAVRARGVQCGLWVAAIARAEGTVSVAACEAETCGAPVVWPAPSPAAWTLAPASPQAESPARWPAWATWAIAGVGVAGAAAAIVVASGALKSAPTETRFVNGGVQIHSF